MLYKAFEKRIEALDAELQDINANLHDTSTKDFTPITAFVTFSYIADQKQALSKYKSSLCNYLSCGASQLSLKGKRIRVRRAPEPSSIIWENIQYSSWDRFSRRSFAFVASLSLILISVAAIFTAKYFMERALHNGSHSAASSLCPANFDTFSNDEQIAITKQFPALLGCFCDSQVSLIADAKDTCTTYARNLLKAQIIVCCASFIVVLVNNLLDQSMRYASRFELHRSLDGRSLSTFLRLFVLKFINSAAIFLINSNGTILHQVYGLPVQSTTSAVDFDVDWFQTTAIMIVLVQLGDVFSTHWRSVSQYYALQRRKYYAQHAGSFVALTQQEMNESCLGPVFELSFRYAQLLTTLFVTATFGPGIPILYAIAATHLLLFYFVEKYMFIHLYRKPSHFVTTLLGRRATSFLPLALLLHIGMSLWIVSNSDLFAFEDRDTAVYNDDNDGLTPQRTGSISALRFGRTVLRRILRGRASFPLFAALCVIVVVTILLLCARYLQRWIQVSYLGLCSIESSCLEAHMYVNAPCDLSPSSYELLCVLHRFLC